MVGVAQLVRAPGCGPGGRGFKSHHSPKYISGYSVVRLTRLLWEQEIGSSNLSTPTLRAIPYASSINALLNCRAFVFHILSYLFINNQKVDTKMVDTLFKPIWAYELLSGCVNLPSAQRSQKKV